MNKEELKELAATLNGIADGKAWEFQGPQENWYVGDLAARNPQRLAADGWKIRLKQQPEPFAELKAAHAAGKKLQHRCPSESKWSDCSVTDTQQDPYCFVFEPECYRIKPEPQKVPLEPSDVPPGSVLRRSEWLSAWQSIFGAYDRGVSFNGALWEWDDIIDTHQINRSIPLTGKWNPEAWEPCYKLIDTP